MPLYDFTCEDGHTTEALMSFEERDHAVQEHGTIAIPCPVCGKLAMKDQLQQTGNMAIQWARAARGQSS